LPFARWRFQQPGCLSQWARLVIAKASLRVLGQSLVREFHPKEFTLSV
jgi:hypothetical protein